jgi:hypothetical protein
MSDAMRAWAMTGALLLSSCCLFGGGGPVPEPDPEVLAFARRIAGFYQLLEKRPLDVQTTFESEELRAYFAGGEDFQTYYALVAAQVRAALFRNFTIESSEIEAFEFPEPDVATVKVTFTGPHERALRLGGSEVSREDTWRRIDGRWVLSPGKL